MYITIEIAKGVEKFLRHQNPKELQNSRSLRLYYQLELPDYLNIRFAIIKSAVVSLVALALCRHVVIRNFYRVLSFFLSGFLAFQLSLPVMI